MDIPNPPQPLLALTSELRERSEKRTKTNLFQILSKLSGTIFFQESPALATLRDALVMHIHPFYLTDRRTTNSFITSCPTSLSTHTKITNHLLPVSWTTSRLGCQMSTTYSTRVSPPSLRTVPEQREVILNTFSNIPILAAWVDDGITLRFLGSKFAHLVSLT